MGEGVKAVERCWIDIFLKLCLCVGYVVLIRVRELVIVAARKSWSRVEG